MAPNPSAVCGRSQEYGVAEVGASVAPIFFFLARPTPWTRRLGRVGFPNLQPRTARILACVVRGYLFTLPAKVAEDDRVGCEVTSAHSFRLHHVRSGPGRGFRPPCCPQIGYAWHTVLRHPGASRLSIVSCSFLGRPGLGPAEQQLRWRNPRKHSCEVGGWGERSRRHILLRHASHDRRSTPMLRTA